MSESDQHDDNARAARDDADVAGGDQEIERTTDADSSAARLFDVRRVIGGLFTVYGVLVLGAGILDGSEASDKASGIDINVWTGIGMLALGLLMLLWIRLSPTAVVQEGGGPDTEDDSRG